MKYKFFYSIFLILLYTSSALFLVSTHAQSIVQGSLSLLSSLLFYHVAKHIVYATKEWILSSLIACLLFFGSLFFLSPFLAFGISISYLSALFIQVFLDEICRSTEEL